MRKCIAAAMVGLLVGAGGAQAGAPDCATERESDAFSVRQMQTYLMVAALSCGRGEYRDSYNHFVTKHRAALKTNGDMLRAYFARHHGAAATTRLDRYITSLANQASLRHLKSPAFCERGDALFTRLNAIDQVHLERQARVEIANGAGPAVSPEPPGCVRTASEGDEPVLR